MKQVNLIVAVDKNFAIGNKGDIPWHISADMKYFRNTTSGKSIIMGRKTLESFPGSKPLPNRKNIVLTRNKDFKIEGAFVVNSISEALMAADDDCFIIGGGEIYKMFLPYVKYAYVTKVDSEFEADTYMVNLDKEDGWKLHKKGETLSENGIEFSFDIYENSNVKSIID